jgi:biotin-[acetyl-CoA-carboxylase] ligase BirA-like protein
MKSYPILSFYYEDLDSTMNEAHRLMSKGIIENNQIVLISTEQQNSGKGTRGKSWASPYGAGIYISAVFKFGTDLNIKITNDFSSKIAEILIISINDYLSHKGAIIDLELKKPNDIYCQGGKLAGILIESKKEEYLIIGIGINWKKVDRKIKEFILEAPKAPPVSFQEVLDQDIFQNMEKSELEQWIISTLTKRLAPQYPLDT